nr:zinc finger, CCHC-type [Tanacetum cinerariifolium]
MHFLLTTLKVVYVLSTPMSDLLEDDDTLETVRHISKWENDDYIYSGRILTYMAEDSSSKKFPWNDSGATTHVCKDHCWFKTYEPVEDGSVLYMGDDHFDPIHRKGSVVLEFSFGKSITLFNVLLQMDLQKEDKVDGTIDKFKARLVFKIHSDWEPQVVSEPFKGTLNTKNTTHDQQEGPTNFALMAYTSQGSSSSELRQVNTARPKAMINAVRTNWVNNVKAFAC